MHMCMFLERMRTRKLIILLLALSLFLLALAFLGPRAPSGISKSSEAGFTSHSPRGVLGGAIIPASCESGYEHFPDECSQPPPTPSGCGPGTLNDTCLLPPPPPPPPPPTPSFPSGCGPGTLNDACLPPTPPPVDPVPFIDWCAWFGWGCTPSLPPSFPSLPQWIPPSPAPNNPSGGTGGTGGSTGGAEEPATSCTPQNLCSGSNIYFRDASCNDSLVERCDYGCSSGVCNPPPPIGFISFDAIGISGPFTATGHLQARPLLLRGGDSTRLYWQASNISSCSVSGTNGDAWAGGFSGPTGRITSAINGETTFTLSCTALPGATPPSVTETQIVSVAPVFREI